MQDELEKLFANRVKNNARVASNIKNHNFIAKSILNFEILLFCFFENICGSQVHHLKRTLIKAKGNFEIVIRLKKLRIYAIYIIWIKKVILSLILLMLFVG